MKFDNLIQELQMYKRPKNQLEQYYIQSRLNKSLEVYLDDIQKSIDLMSIKDGIKVIKRINKS